MRRHCRPVCQAFLRRRAQRSKCGSPGVLRCHQTRCRHLLPWSSEQAITGPPPNIALCPRACDVGDQLLLGPLRARVQRILDHPRLIELRFEGRSGSDLAWPGPPRASHPVRLRGASAVDRRHVDAGGRPARRVRAAVRWIHPGLVDAAGAARTSRSFRHHHPRRRHLFHWRCRTRCDGCHWTSRTRSRPRRHRRSTQHATQAAG